MANQIKEEQSRMVSEIGRSFPHTIKNIADTIALHDRSNDGLTPAAVIERLQDIKPGVTKKQAGNHLHRTLKKNHSDVIKKHVVVGQATTTNQNAITVVQQFRWHSTVDTTIMFLRKKNVGICKCGCGKTFGELIDEFIYGANETCMMASGGMIKIMGAAGRNKQEITNGDLRDFITMLRTGSSASRTGASIFIVKGTRVREGIDTKYLMDWGAGVGSRIVANENAFMTTERWEKITLSLIEGYHNMNEHARANPDWWCLEIIDVFSAHLASYKVMKMRYDAKILTV